MVFSVYLSSDGHLGWFYTLLGVQVPLLRSDLRFFRNLPRSGIAGVLLSQWLNLLTFLLAEYEGGHCPHPHQQLLVFQMTGISMQFSLLGFKDNVLGSQGWS